MNLKWRIDLRDLQSARVRAAAAQGVIDAAEALLTNANARVPIEESTLERSGTVSSDRDALKASVSYDTPYARRQHEDTSLRHDPGREAKWLERSLKEIGPKFGPYIAKKIKSAGA